ncbi:MAG: AAA family ATPase [Nanoarchaeota archaeon]|nr:AAA family ATPase [Nanoarchaeota archaeon]
MATNPKRIPTGIDGFDKLIQGGFNEKSVSLISGAPGTGKTIFSLAFAYFGAMKYDQKCVYVTFEQPIADLEEQAIQFGWDLKKLQKDKKLHMVYIPIEGVHSETLQMIKDLVEQNNAERLVIDSISTLSIAAPHYSDIKTNYSSQAQVKYFVYDFIYTIRALGCTTLMIGELKDDNWINEEVPAEFVVDNVVVLRYFGAKGSSSRTLAIKKARKTKFDENIFPFTFAKTGIKVGQVQKVAMKF